MKELRSIVGSLFIQDRKAVKRKTGDECWETHLRISRLNHDVWIQWEKTVSKQKSRLQQRINSNRETFLHLFSTSRVGLTCLEDKAKGQFRSVEDGFRDQPILLGSDRSKVGCTRGRKSCPVNPGLPNDDEQIRHDRSKEWEKMEPKEYKVMVLDIKHREVNRPIYEFDVLGFERLIELHERKLKFRTDFRPRSRYIWWTFLNAIFRTAWNKTNDRNIQHEEAQKSACYWGKSFVEEIGHDVESILTIGTETEEQGEICAEGKRAAERGGF
ncbi:unnamed protein product [Fusarium venenatum]|uniref:Uncharacterized protein n=1 Tax=Fusarium venenatum TaxID=56646 RepID=A0A2L2SYT1_9HYPO|nr:uncharacterized protein FVRRES_07658 [Fusarium venenatum]CEI63222.1 unnamed protein product [Fusarium venenatum]